MTPSRVSASFDDHVMQLPAAVDDVPTNSPMSNGRCILIIFEYKEAVNETLMIIKGRAPQFKHIPRTHRIDLDWLCERIRYEPGVYMKYMGTKEQMADSRTKGSFCAQQWRALCGLIQLGKPYALEKPETSTDQDQPQAGTNGNSKNENKSTNSLNPVNPPLCFSHPQPFAAQEHSLRSCRHPLQLFLALS